MKSRAILITSILLSGLTLFGQPAETTYEGTLIAEGFTQGILASDGPFPIGFNFTFFGNTYSQFYVSANGLVTFTDPDGLFNTEVTIPAAATPNNYIAPFWDNLSIVDGGNILYRTFGASTNRKCVIQFKNMGFDPIPTPLGTFTVILYEDTNVIQIQYIGACGKTADHQATQENQTHPGNCRSQQTGTAPSSTVGSPVVGWRGSLFCHRVIGLG